MSVHEEYTDIIEKRYSNARHENYETEGLYLGVLYGPEQYRTEVSMLSYVKSHPAATLKEVSDYFNKITPDGLAPGDDGADLWEDD